MLRAATARTMLPRRAGMRALGSRPNNMVALVRALEDAGIEFILRTKRKGPGLRLRE